MWPIRPQHGEYSVIAEHWFADGERNGFRSHLRTANDTRFCYKESGTSQGRLMTGLSVLYAKEAANERDWKATPDRERTGRLREVYWARRAESRTRRHSFMDITLNWRPERTDVGRRRDDPGDGFNLYLVDMMRNEDRFEWLEVTEVFTTVPASQIESAMRAWNGIPGKRPVDFDTFRDALPRALPSRNEQRKAADKAIAQVERKLSKSSYEELLERYGYGTLVVGMPLWFAVPPDDPWRAQNALDDFMTRTTLGLEDVKQRVLRRRTCPFRNVIVTWDTTPQAMHEWYNNRSAAGKRAFTKSAPSRVVRTECCRSRPQMRRLVNS